MKTNEQLNTYTVNGEGWEHDWALFRATNKNGWVFEFSREPAMDSNIFFIDNSDKLGRKQAMVSTPNGNFSEVLYKDWESSLEQRHTDQQIALLQKDEGWIVDTEAYEVDMTKGEEKLRYDYYLDDGSTREFSCAHYLSPFSLAVPKMVDDKPTVLHPVAYRLTTNADYFEGVERVTLQEGDYVDSGDMIVLSRTELDSVINAFLFASDDDENIEVWRSRVIEKKLGWSARFNSLAHNLTEKSKKRHLTVEQVLNAKNAKSDPKDIMLNLNPDGIKPMENEPVSFSSSRNADEALGKDLRVYKYHENDTPEPEYLPKVGDECEFYFENCAFPAWKPVKITAIGKQWILYLIGENEFSASINTKFRPAQTPRE